MIYAGDVAREREGAMAGDTERTFCVYISDRGKYRLVIGSAFLMTNECVKIYVVFRLSGWIF